MPKYLQFYSIIKLIGTWKVTMFFDENNKISIEHSKKEQTHSEKVLICPHQRLERFNGLSFGLLTAPNYLLTGRRAFLVLLETCSAL